MSEEMGPGDFVECIVGGEHKLGGASLIEGSVYRLGRHGSDGKSFVVDGHSPKIDGFRLTWFAYRFKPIYKPSSTLLESLRTISREQVLA